VDPRADLYACGVVLYEMLTGERPAGTDLPSDLNRAVPRHLDEAFRRSYARLDKRFTSAAEFARALTVTPPPMPFDNRAAYTAAPPVPPDYRASSRYVPVRPDVTTPPLPTTHGTNRHQCTQCHQPVEPTDQFCMHCGVQLVENVRRCPQCGAYPDATDQYCIFCGQVLAPQDGIRV
jgi:serine/threonine protein kinase